MSAEKEYERLGQEILKWQDRRFTVLSGTVTLVVGFVAYALQHPTSWAVREAVTLVFMLLALASAFSWYAGIGNSRVGAYLDVYHGSSWESVLRGLSGQGKWVSRREMLFALNKLIALVYLVLAVGSWFLLSRRLIGRSIAPDWLLGGATILLSLCLLAQFFDSPRAEYVERIQDIKKSDKPKLIVWSLDTVADMQVTSWKECLVTSVKQLLELGLDDDKLPMKHATSVDDASVAERSPVKVREGLFIETRASAELIRSWLTTAVQNTKVKDAEQNPIEVTMQIETRSGEIHQLPPSA